MREFATEKEKTENINILTKVKRLNGEKNEYYSNAKRKKTIVAVQNLEIYKL